VSGSGAVTPGSSPGMVSGGSGSGSGLSRSGSGSSVDIGTSFDFEVSPVYPGVRFQERSSTLTAVEGWEESSIIVCCWLVRVGECVEVIEMAKKVRDVMTAEPRSAEPTLSLVEAAQLMKSEDVGSLPIVEEGRLLAVLTDRDIVVRAVAEGVDPKATVIGEVASRDPVTVEPEQDLDEALLLMAQHQVRRLPVVESDRLVGVLAQADVAQEAKAKQAGEVVEQISKPTGIQSS
jgi:CBS domain-containing protein